MWSDISLEFFFGSSFRNCTKIIDIILKRISEGIVKKNPWRIAEVFPGKNLEESQEKIINKCCEIPKGIPAGNPRGLFRRTS